MKKIKLIFTTALCLTFLVGCGKSRLPSTKYEKVQYALSGVEKSLTKQKAATKNLKLLPRGKRSEADAIDAIYNVFTDGTASQPDFKYDEPPMIQFLYIKKTLEKIGKGFDFGVKYQETITGSIYYDFTTGKDTQEQSFKQDYSLNFSLYINIDDNDLINCKTLFDVNYTHDRDVHHQSMYAELLLDYDMKKTDANYKLKLFAVDDCSGFTLDEEKYFSAEYDYVDVSNDAINEWGKIGYSTNKAIVFDETHSSLSDYSSDSNLKFKPTIQLYRNGKRYQRNQLSDSQTLQAVTIACDELGVNGTDIKYKDYISQSATAQPKLKECFNDFSNIYGRDLMYNIVYTGAKQDEHQGGSEDTPRVDATWPTQGLIDDGYGDVPGFLSKTATFDVTREYTTDTDSYFYLITVLNYQDDDFATFERALSQKGFTATKDGDAVLYIHRGSDGVEDYGVAIFHINGMDIITIGMLVKEEPKVDIVIQNANDYTGDYSSFEETTYETASQIASTVETVSGGRINASTIEQYVVVGSSKSYAIKLDRDEYTSDDLNRNYTEYVKTYSNWNVIDSNGAFYKTVNGVDVLVMLDKDSSNGIINIHAFTFTQGSIEQILSGGQGGGEGGEGGEGGGGQQVLQATVSLYEIDPSEGTAKFINSHVFNDGETINVKETFGEGNYFEDEGCVLALNDVIIVHDGMSIYRKIESQTPTQGSIVIVDANTKLELFSYTDVIGATVKGGQIFNFVLYKDESCGTKVGLNEELTLSAEPQTLYCQDYSKEDYVTLTVNTYINGILSQDHVREFGIRKGEILSNYNSNSFPAYYAHASYYDNDFTMTLNGDTLGNYSQELIALTENGVLNIYCANDWCKVYHIVGASEFDIVWESGSLQENDVVFYNSRYYHISSVSEDSATYDSTQVVYTYNLCSVFNGKIITTEKQYFTVENDQGMSFIINPDAEPEFFLDAELTTPLVPEQGKSVVEFKNSFTLYKRFSK